MAENWAPCRNCPHVPDDHEAIPVKAIAVDHGTRAVFEGTLGGCLAEGCGCRMWQQEKLTAKEMAREGREPPPEGYELVAVPDEDWRAEGGRSCRYGGSRPCGQPSVATLERGTSRKQLWGYCPAHLFGRWTEGGKVMHWVLRAKDGSR